MGRWKRLEKIGRKPKLLKTTPSLFRTRWIKRCNRWKQKRSNWPLKLLRLCKSWRERTRTNRLFSCSSFCFGFVFWLLAVSVSCFFFSGFITELHYRAGLLANYQPLNFSILAVLHYLLSAFLS